MNNLFKNLAIWLVIGLVLMTIFNQCNARQATQTPMEYSQFIEEVKGGRIAKVLIEGRVLKATTTPSSVPNMALTCAGAQLSTRSVRSPSVRMTPRSLATQSSPAASCARERMFGRSCPALISYVRVKGYWASAPDAIKQHTRLSRRRITASRDR